MRNTINSTLDAFMSSVCYSLWVNMINTGMYYVMVWYLVSFLHKMDFNHDLSIIRMILFNGCNGEIQLGIINIGEFGYHRRLLTHPT